MVPLQSRDTLQRIRVDVRELRRVLGEEATMAYCFVCGAPGRAFSRGMIPWELYEDPATGSAGGSLGAYLGRHEKLGANKQPPIGHGGGMGGPSPIPGEGVEETGELFPR